MIALKFFVVALCVGSAVSQFLTYPGKCPKYQVMKNFDLAKYQQKIWYDQYAYPFYPDFKRKCNFGNVTFSPTTVGTLGTIRSWAFSLDTNTPQAFSWNAVIRSVGSIAIDWARDAKFSLTNYNVLGTDYKTYSCVYFCKAVNATHYNANGFFLGGTRQTNSDTLKTVKNVFKQNGVPFEYMEKIDQSNCPADSVFFNV